MKTPTEVVETIEAGFRAIKSHAHCVAELASDMTDLSVAVFNAIKDGRVGDADVAIWEMRRVVENMSSEIRHLDVAFRVRNALTLAADQFTDADFNAEGENDE